MQKQKLLKCHLNVELSIIRQLFRTEAGERFLHVICEAIRVSGSTESLNSELRTSNLFSLVSQLHCLPACPSVSHNIF